MVQQLQRRRTQQEGRSVRVPSACDGDADGDRVVSDQVDLRAQVDDREGSLVASRPPPGAGLRVEPAVSRPWPSASPIAAGPTSRTGAGDCGVCAAGAGVTCDGGRPSIRRLMVASAAAAAAATAAAAADAATCVGETLQMFMPWAFAPAWHLAAPTMDMEAVCRLGVHSAVPVAPPKDCEREDEFHPARHEDKYTTHLMAIKRAINKAMHRQHAHSSFRTDGTTVDPRQPEWQAPPTGKPRAGDPAAMYAAYKKVAKCCVDDSMPTHKCGMSQRWGVWQVMHNATCSVCTTHSAAQLVTCRTPSEVAAWAPTSAPSCYGRWMVHSVRTGFDPEFVTRPVPGHRPNHSPVYDDFAVTAKHMDEVEDFDVYTPPSFDKPYLSSPLLTVVRDKHRRQAAADGVVAKGRVAIDMRTSAVNECLAPWPFDYDTVDAAARLMRPGNYIGKTDLRKYFLFLPASPGLQKYLWFSDPRHEPSSAWRGKGPPSAAWSAHQASRARRTGRWRGFTTCPFGISVLPAYASFLSGEMCRMARAIGVKKVVMMIDDAFVVADTESECAEQMSMMASLFRLLGLEPADDKQEGPLEVLDFLGYDMDTVKGTITVKTKRLQQTGEDMRTMVASGSATCDDLRSLAGKMSWYALVLANTRSFMRRIWDHLRDTPDVPGPVALSDGALDDLRWWLKHIDANDFRGSKIYYGHDVDPDAVLSDLLCSWASQRDHDASVAAGERVYPVSGQQAIGSSRPARCVEMAAGAGGFAVGASAVDGLDVVMAIEGCPEAAATYERAHGLKPDLIDLTDVDAVVAAVRLLGAIDMIFASPPCQAWSPAGTHTPGDERINVMGAVIDAVLRLLPPTLVVENVPEMLWSQQWLSFEKLLSGAGYTVETCIVDAAKLGVPQRRRRAIVVASLHGGVVGLKAACDVVQAGRTTVMSDEFPGMGHFYHRHRQSWGQCIYCPKASPTPPLRTNCVSVPRASTYRRRPGDVGSIHGCHVLNVPELSRAMGFPSDYPWPEQGVKCRCKFCSKSGVTSTSRQIGNAICPAVAQWAASVALARRDASEAPLASPPVARSAVEGEEVPTVCVRSKHVDGFGEIVDVKSDAAGDARLCFHVDTSVDGGHLVYTRLVGGDASIHVPFYELAAVYLCTMMYSHTWRGKVVRFGVDSAPVVSMLNTGSSPDPDLMRLLRDMADSTFAHNFDWLAVHTTRSRNALADQGTRHSLVQDFQPFLGAEGYATLAPEATPASCPTGRSQLRSCETWRLRLGQRRQCSGSPRRSATRAASCGSTPSCNGRRVATRAHSPRTSWCAS